MFHNEPSSNTPQTSLNSQTFQILDIISEHLPHFTGYARRPELEQKALTKILTPSKDPIACTGIGGVGKTQLLTYLVHTPEVQSHFKSIFWFNASDIESSLDIQYHGLATELKLVDEKTPYTESKKALIKWLEAQTQPWLLVFDNADNPELLRTYLPTRGGQILLSSRSPQWANALSVELMTLQEVQELLAKLMPERIITPTDAEQLAQTLDYLPLALTQAIAMIRQDQMSIPEYLKIYQQTLNANIQLFGKNLPHSMVTLYELQLQKLKDTPALTLLQYSALLAPDHIPLHLLQLLTTPEIYPEAQEQLLNYALWQPQDKDIRIHRLMQEVIRLSLTPEQFNTLFLNLSEKINDYYNEETTALEDEARHKSLIPHLQALQHRAENQEALKSHPNFAGILLITGGYYRKIGQPKLAKSLDERALAIFQAHYGSNHLSIGITLKNLGMIYGDLGDYAQQKALLTRALAIDDAHYGPNHPLTGQTLMNLGNAYGDLGDYAQKKALLTRALAIKEAHYGPDHPETGITITNLGNAYGQLGDYAQSQALLTRALAINEAHYGPNHPLTAPTLTNLGDACTKLKDYAKAKEYLRRALVINEKAYGGEHISTAYTLMNLADVHFKLKEKREAYIYAKRAHSLFLGAYGKNHRDTSYCARLLKQLPTYKERSEPLIFTSPQKHLQEEGQGYTEQSRLLSTRPQESPEEEKSKCKCSLI